MVWYNLPEICPLEDEEKQFTGRCLTGGTLLQNHPESVPREAAVCWVLLAYLHCRSLVLGKTPDLRRKTLSSTRSFQHLLFT